MTKYKQLETNSVSFTKLKLFPRFIFHDKLDETGKWVKEQRPWYFSLIVDDILDSYHLSYNLIDAEDGVIQYLPIPEEEVEDAREIGYYGSYTGGFRGNDLQELINEMYTWLYNSDLIE